MNALTKLFFKFNKFLVGGILSIFIKMGLTIFLTEILGIWYFISYVITIGVIVVFSFFYNVHITFKIKHNKKQNFVKYCLALAIFSIIDALGVKLLTEILQVHYTSSIILITVVLFLAKFIVYNQFIFTKSIKEKNVPGNFYAKHKSRNIFVRWLMKKFYIVLFRIISKIKPRTMLDIGCGEGYSTAKIHRRFQDIKVEGCDLEFEVINLAKEKFGDIKFTVESAYNLKRNDNSFEIVSALEVLEHLEYPEKAIRECKRVSKKYCIFSVPNEPWWRIINMLRLAYLPRFGNTPGHIQHWTRKKFRKMLKRHFKHVMVRKAMLWNFALCWD